MMQNNRWTQSLIVLLVLIASAWLLAQVWAFVIQFSSILILFFVSWLLAFILRPVARWMSGRGMPYGAAVALVYLGLALALVLGAIYLVPVITRQIQNLVSTIENSQELIAEGEQILKGWGLNDSDIQQIYSNIANSAQTIIVQTLTGMADLLGRLATFVFQLILVFLLSFYFMKDGDRIGGNLLAMLPPRWQDEVRLASLGIEKSFGGFVRGQLVFAMVYAVLTAILMVVPPFQLDLWLIASLVAGLCMMIPLIGNLLAFAPPMLVLLLDPDKVSLWWIFLLVMFIMQSIMMNVLGPRIMSSAIGIHPIYVWAAMLMGSQVAGIWGALFGIPIAGAINLIGRPVLRRIRHQTSLYRDAQLPSPTTASFLTGPLAVSMAEARAQSSALGHVQQPPATPTRAAAPHGGSAPLNPAPPRAEAAPQPPDDLDADLPRPGPTMTARAWRNMRTWARTRMQARATRQ